MWDAGVNMAHSPSPRCFHSATIIGDLMYIFGGNSEEGLDNDIFTFDLSLFIFIN